MRSPTKRQVIGTQSFFALERLGVQWNVTQLFLYAIKTLTMRWLS